MMIQPIGHLEEGIEEKFWPYLIFNNDIPVFDCELKSDAPKEAVEAFEKYKEYAKANKDEWEKWHKMGFC